jgi:hypothetical protein
VTPSAGRRGFFARLAAWFSGTSTEEEMSDGLDSPEE